MFSWLSLDLNDDKSTLLKVMAWWRQATSHYLGQCWTRSMSPYGVIRLQWVYSTKFSDAYTVYPKKYAHGFVVLCFVVVMQSFIMNSHEVFIHIHQGCFAGTGAIVRLPQCQWSKPNGYGKISQCITTTKQKPCAYFLGYTVCVSNLVDHWFRYWLLA